MDLKAALLLLAIAVSLGVMAARIFAAPLKLLGRVALNTLLGLGSLLLVNATNAVTGLHLGMNLFNALVVGILGAPGLGLLLLVQWVLGT